MSHSESFLCSSALAIMIDSGPAAQRKINKLKLREQKCLLPSCNKSTPNNKGYCSEEHCWEHRKLLKIHSTKGK